MSETDPRPPAVWASLGTTINIGNFENYKIDIGVSGIPIDATPEVIKARLDQAKLTLQQVVFSLAEELGQREQDVRTAFGVPKGG
jgi:hypothetical protein